jgi:dephospho-CoA kinase
MKKIAITGSIACGKTTLLNALATHCFSVFNCDSTIAELYKSPEVLKKIKEMFPICFENDAFDKKKLLGILTQQPFLLKKLEGILYPYLNTEMMIFEEKSRRKNEKMVFFEVPLLFEKRMEKFYDQIIVINSTKRKRQNNFIERGGNIKVFQVLNSVQWSDIKKVCIAKKYGFLLFPLTSIKMLPKNITVLLNKIKECTLI